MKIVYRRSVQETIKAEGLTAQEVTEALRAIQDAAAGKPKPLHLNLNIEAIRDTNLQWYRLKPKGAKYRIVFSLQRKQDTLTVEGIFRRDALTYQRIKHLYHATTDKTQSDL